MIDAGDIVCADDNGVVVLPRNRLHEVLAKLPEVIAREAATDELVRGAAKVPPWLEEALKQPCVTRI
jgi:regulator of RNase E activity RraA